MKFKSLKIGEKFICLNDTRKDVLIKKRKSNQGNAEIFFKELYFGDLLIDIRDDEEIQRWPV